MAKRTSLALDPDVDRKLRRLMRAKNKSLRRIVNELLRRSLKEDPKGLLKKTPFQVHPVSMGLQSGVDPEKLNLLNDEVQTEDFLHRDTRKQK